MKQIGAPASAILNVMFRSTSLFFAAMILGACVFDGSGISSGEGGGAPADLHHDGVAGERDFASVEAGRSEQGLLREDAGADARADVSGDLSGDYRQGDYRQGDLRHGDGGGDSVPADVTTRPDVGPWYSGWSFRKEISIHGAKVGGSASLKNFPLLIRFDTGLKDKVHGGPVVQADGGDILFTGADGTTQLDHEIEDYDAVKGALVAWVKIPNLALASDTTIYIYYGSTNLADQWNRTATWDEGGKNDFRGVWHLARAPQKSTSITTQDATSYGNDGRDPWGSFDLTNEVGGKIGKGFRSEKYEAVDVGKAASLDITGDVTISYWANFASGGGQQEYAAPVWRHDGSQSIRTYLVYYHYDQHWGFSTTYASDSQDYRDISFSKSHADGKWHHWTVVRSFNTPGGGGTISFYFDGKLINTGTFRAGLTQAKSTPTTHSYFGSLEGIFDEVRISAVARSPEWIKASHESQKDSKFVAAGPEEKL